MRTAYSKRRLFVVPAAKVKAVNDKLQQLGYGPDNLSIPVIGKMATATAKPSHYVCDIAIKPKHLTIIEALIEKQGGKTVDAGPVTTAKRLDSTLSQENLKTKATSAIEVASVGIRR